MTTTPTPTIYRSRWKTNRRRLLLAASALVLVLSGVLIDRLRGDSPAAGSAVVSTSSSLAPSSLAPSSDPTSDPPPSAPPSPTTPGGIDAYAPIQAEMAALAGIDKQDTEDEGGGQNVGWVNNGDSMRFDAIDFGDTPATQLIARVASGVGDGVNGRMEIRIDSPGNPPVGSLPVKNTGGWQNWISQATDVSGVTGVHTVFVTFAADRGDDFVNVNYLKFGR
jgi:hypothetical protein